MQQRLGKATKHHWRQLFCRCSESLTTTQKKVDYSITAKRKRNPRKIFWCLFPNECESGKTVDYCKLIGSGESHGRAGHKQKMQEQAALTISIGFIWTASADEAVTTYNGNHANIFDRSRKGLFGACLYTNIVHNPRYMRVFGVFV